MMDWKHRHDHCAFRDLHVQTGGIFRYISVGQHNALAFSCCSGGKHDSAKLIRFRHIIEASTVLFKKLPEGKCMIVMFSLLHGDQELQLRTALLCHCRHIFAHFIVNKYGRI